MPTSQIVRALIVDDSAFTRKAVREMLSRSPYVEVVGTARDGMEGLEMAEQLKPDVIVSDLTMPNLNGPAFVREQMSRRPVPILIFSVANQDAQLAVDALEAGAVDFVQKPTSLANDELFDAREALVEKVKAAGRAPKTALQPASAERPRVQYPRRLGRIQVIVIGISTGGPQALRSVLPQLPANLPVPIAIVLHMPLGFTALYAEKLDELCQLDVKEAAEGDELLPGHCLLAQAGMHLTFRHHNGGPPTAHLTIQPVDAMHRPSVDVLFRSAADVFGDRVLGVVMTGMGNDGKAGAAWIKAKGGTVLTEAESSCVIYGMPRSVVEAGLSDGAVPLEQLPQAIVDQL